VPILTLHFSVLLPAAALSGPLRLVQGNAAFIARFPVYLPFSAVGAVTGTAGWNVPPTKNDASMYGTAGTAGSGFYGSGNGNSNLGITRVASGAGEWSPFECGSACYNATHYLWCGRARANMTDAHLPSPTLPSPSSTFRHLAPPPAMLGVWPLRALRV